MPERTFIGSRVQVFNADQTLSLGLGTHLGEIMVEELGGSPSPRILLDTGECIYGYECWWREMTNTPVRGAFDHTLGRAARLFDFQGRMLFKSGDILPKGLIIRIESLHAMFYDHRDCIAAAIRRGDDTRFLLTEEMTFPRFGK